MLVAFITSLLYRLATSRPHEFLSARSELFKSDEGLF